MSRAPTWEEVRPRFQRMALALGYLQASRKMKIGKSTLYRWLQGGGRVKGAPPVRPQRRKLRAMVAALRRWEKAHDRVRTLKPAPVWRGWDRLRRVCGKNEPASAWGSGALAYR